MISQAIQAMKVNQNAKNGCQIIKKNETFIIGLCATSDDWKSDLSDKSQLKCEKMTAKLSKNEMLIFGLCSTSDDRPSNLSNEKSTEM